MKTIRLLIAALAVALGVLPANLARGQQQQSTGTTSSSTLPVFIPTADTIEGLYDWAVTNQQVYAGITMYSYTTNMVYLKFGTPTSFDSYAQYRAYLTSNVMSAVTMWQTNGNDPNTPMRIAAPILYLWNTPYTPSVIDTNGIKLSDITSNLVDSIVPRYLFVIISVPGLQQFTVNVTNSASYYSNGWSAVTGTSFPKIMGNAIVNPYPPEKTTTDTLVLNPWYLERTNHVRFLLESTNDTGTYTQLGPRITPATLLSSPGPGCIRIQANYTPGSDTDFLCSTDMMNWVPVPTTVLSSNVTSETVLINKSSPNMYFRTASH